MSCRWPVHLFPTCVRTASRTSERGSHECGNDQSESASALTQHTTCLGLAWGSKEVEGEPRFTVKLYCVSIAGASLCVSFWLGLLRLCVLCARPRPMASPDFVESAGALARVEETRLRIVAKVAASNSSSDCAPFAGLLRRLPSSPRELIVDASRSAHWNGIGNQYGDYMLWFTIAALTSCMNFSSL